MKRDLILVSILSLINVHTCFCQEKIISNKRNIITIEGEVPPGYTKQAMEVNVYPLQSINNELLSTAKTISQNVVDGRVKWTIESDKALCMYSLLTGPVHTGGARKYNYSLEPGDRILVKFQNDKPVFTGKGTLKFDLVYKLGILDDSLKNSPLCKNISKEHGVVTSLDDYISWNKYLDNYLSVTLQLTDSYKGKVSGVVYNYIKESIFNAVEERRLAKFIYLVGQPAAENTDNKPNLPVNQFGLNNADLCAIYDSTLCKSSAKWLQYEGPAAGTGHYLYNIVKLEAYRKKGRFLKNKSTDTSIIAADRGDAYLVRYNIAKEKYTGIRREKALFTFVGSYIGTLYNYGFTPQTEAIMADYYAQPGYPEFKETAKQYEFERRQKLRLTTLADFRLTDVNAKPFTKADLKGKVAILDFWFTGCTGCVQMAPALAKVEERFKNDTNVVFVSISVDEDKEKWLKSLKQGKYTSPFGVHVYTGGEGSDHSLIKDHFISGYPSLLFIDAFGNLLVSAKRPDTDQGRSMIALIDKELVRMKDGPYVFEESGTKTVYTVSGTEFVKSAAGGILTVQSDQPGQTFRVSLQKEYVNQPSVSERPEKLIALSDIEGNFDKFRMLLQNNKIIDENYNWIFGNGHLVFGGDMFDRGEQVTECLWLIYSLEEKAKAAGGYVHFILGNHEIMNLQGNFRYVKEKYKTSAETMEKPLNQLYTGNTELGKWLRTKNVMEKIGDILFVHGGIGVEFNKQVTLNIQDINSLARNEYANANVYNHPDENVKMIFDSRLGPFWYRQYYEDGDKMLRHEDGSLTVFIRRPTDADLESILARYNAHHIVTGHTVVDDVISTHYGNRIINTDTRHAESKSEALLIEGSKFYRVNDRGERWLLFDDAEKAGSK